jgi:predicted kinase
MKNLKEPFVIILSGIPMSGKTTWIKENYPDTKTISRDEIVMEVYGSRNYNDAFRNVDQKKVDKVLRDRLTQANLANETVIVDMTNLTAKTRAKNLSYFSDNFYKVSVALPILDSSEYKRRNELRMINENKFIPYNVINSMINTYQLPTDSEGFDEIIIL